MQLPHLCIQFGALYFILITPLQVGFEVNFLPILKDKIVWPEAHQERIHARLLHIAYHGKLFICVEHGRVDQHIAFIEQYFLDIGGIGNLAIELEWIVAAFGSTRAGRQTQSEHCYEIDGNR